MYYLSELAAQHVKVVLTGQGADEALGGYKRYQGEIISKKVPRGLTHFSNKLIPYLGIKNERLIRSMHALGEKDDVQRFLKVYSVFYQPEIKQLLNVTENKANDLISYYYDVLNCKEKGRSAERMMAIDTRMNLPDDLLLYTDKITMNFSLECRVPMLDKELINYIETLPANKRVSIRKMKIVHKKFAEKILPKKIINRKKLGFQTPTKIWFKEYNGQIKDLLLKQGRFTDIFNEKAINDILNQHLKGFNREKQIFLFLSIYYWLQENQ